MPGIGGGRTFDLLKEINPDVGVILAALRAEGEARKLSNAVAGASSRSHLSWRNSQEKIREVLTIEAGQPNMNVIQHNSRDDKSIVWRAAEV